MARSLPWLVIGQSYGQVGYRDGLSYYTFVMRFLRASAANVTAINARLGTSYARYDLLQLRNHAVGGTAILEENADGTSGFWVGNDLASDGGRLTDTLTAIAGYAAKPAFVLWSHGERDASVVRTDAAATRVRNAANNRLIPRVRSALNSGAPTSVPVFVDMLGHRNAVDVDGEDLIRDALLRIIEAGTNIYHGAEKYAVELDATLHPTQTGYMTLGAHAGRKAMAYLATGSVLHGPRIGTVTRSGLTITVPITVRSGETLVKPADPAHFGLYDAAGVRMIYSAAWSGDTVSLTTPRPVATLRYPARETKFDAARIIRYASPADPLFAGEPGLPLESIRHRAIA